MSLFMLFLTALFTIGSLLVKRGWHREPRWKNKVFLAGAIMTSVAIALLLLVVVVNVMVFGAKIAIAAVASFLALLWGLRWVFVCFCIIVFFLWLKSKLRKSN